MQVDAELAKEKLARRLDEAARLYRHVLPDLNPFAVIRAEECETWATSIRNTDLTDCQRGCSCEYDEDGGAVLKWCAMHGDQHERARRAETERDRLREALSHLVTLKEYKNVVGKDAFYERNQPIAWANAGIVLDGKPSGLISPAPDQGSVRNATDRQRTCGVCGLRDIPYGTDWPWWVNGNPVHPGCALPDQKD